MKLFIGCFIGLVLSVSVDAESPLENQRRLSRSIQNAASDFYPAWSPDSQRIAFVSRRVNYEIYVMDADGSNLTRLTQNAASDFYLAWSPDSQRIAFMSNRDGDSDIYVMAADGTDLTRLTQNVAADSHPAWSPDGRRIAFVSIRDENRQIYVIDVEYAVSGDE